MKKTTLCDIPEEDRGLHVYLNFLEALEKNEVAH